MKRSNRNILIYLDIINVLYNSALIILCLYLAWSLGTIINSPFWSIIVSLYVFLISFLIIPLVIYYMLPKLEEGKYSLKEKNVLVWTLKFYIKKPLSLPLISEFFSTFHFVQFFMLKMFRTKVSNSFQIAANAFICDPEMVELGEDVTIGGFATLVSHAIVGETLILRKIRIGDNVMLGGGINLNFGTTIGKNTKTAQLVEISNDAVIGENCIIEKSATIGTKCIVGNNVRIGEKACIMRGVRVPDNAIIPAGTLVTEGYFGKQ